MSRPAPMPPAPPRVPTHAAPARSDVRVVVCGARTWHCPELAHRLLGRLKARYGRRLVLVIHDSGEGMAAAFNAEARRLGIRRELWTADRPDDPEAERKLHADMIAAGARFVLAAHRYLPASRGTRHMLLQALVDEVPAYLVDGPDAEPRRVEEA